MFKTASSQAVISILVVLMFGGVLLAIIFHPMTIDQTMQNMLLLLLGALSSNFTSVVSYYMGSSAGSKSANETLHQIVATTTGTGAGTPVSAALTSKENFNGRETDARLEPQCEAEEADRKAD